jgi:DNA mismatch repair protein MLH3
MCTPAIKNHSFHTEQHQCHASQDENFARSLQSDALSRPLTREDLQQAQIIGQVDRKFIACAIPVKQPENGLLETFQIHREPTSTSPALVLIDQHAADERIRVECFLKELCLGFLHYRDEGSSTEKGVTQRGLQPPLPVLLTRHEAILLKASLGIQRTFHNWGFQFDLSKVASVNSDDVSANGSSSGYEQLLVCSVPEVVSEKVCSFCVCHLG